MKEHLTSREFFPEPSFPLTVIRRTPQIPFPMHTHDFTELVIVYGGEGIHTTAGEEYLIRAGDVFVIHGERAHGYQKLSDLLLINIIVDTDVLGLSGSELDEISGYHALFKWEPRLRRKHGFESRLRLPPDELAQVLSTVEVIESEIEHKREGWKFMSRVSFMHLCGFLSRRYTSSQVPRMIDLSRIAGILSFLEANSRRFLSVSEIVNKAGLSESTLLRLFHKTTGFSPIEYHNRLRIRGVCEYLRHSDNTVTGIAYEMGYQDSNYMTRQFRKIMGITPLEYRRDVSLPVLQ